MFGPNIHANPKIMPDTTAIMPAALSAFSAPNQSGP